MTRQKTGRKAKGEAKFPLQAKKLDELIRYLIAQRIISSQGDLAANFGVNVQTVSNWVIGKTEIGIREKKVFEHDFDVPLAWFEDPDMRLEDAIGKWLGKDEAPRSVQAQLSDLSHLVQGSYAWLRAFRQFMRTVDPMLKEREEELQKALRRYDLPTEPSAAEPLPTFEPPKLQ